MLSVAKVLDPKQSNSTPPLNLRSQICHLDSHLLSLSAKCHAYIAPRNVDTVEAHAGQCMGMIAYIVIQSYVCHCAATVRSINDV